MVYIAFSISEKFAKKNGFKVLKIRVYSTFAVKMLENNIYHVYTYFRALGTNKLEIVAKKSSPNFRFSTCDENQYFFLIVATSRKMFT